MRLPSFTLRFVSLCVDVKHDVTMASISFLIRSLLGTAAVITFFSSIGTFTNATDDLCCGIESLFLSVSDGLELDIRRDAIGLEMQKKPIDLSTS